ncbi:MAG TPA: hypothetical protein VK114_00525 [Nitrososphaerales archaeon]|nr:hypothetical protein [Nitrososphaerales archaeon]
MADLRSREVFSRDLRSALKPRYIDRHPFMRLLYKGELSKKQIHAWLINRFYLQNNIISKDAAILSNCPLPEIRRIWMSRTIRREGLERPPGDVEGWLILAESAGLRREEVLAARCLPGVRFAVNDLVNFARRASWLEGVSTSLYEVPARDELARRIEGLKKFYKWIRPEGMKFFLSRLAQLERDSEVVLDIVMKYCTGREMQDGAIAAALQMGEVTWSIHDAVYMNYVIEDRSLADSV